MLALRCLNIKLGVLYSEEKAGIWSPKYRILKSETLLINIALIFEFDYIYYPHIPQKMWWIRISIYIWINTVCHYTMVSYYYLTLNPFDTPEVNRLISLFYPFLFEPIKVLSRKIFFIPMTFNNPLKVYFF